MKDVEDNKKKTQKCRNAAKK